MEGLLLFVDISLDREYPSVVHKMNVINGDYLSCYRLNGSNMFLQALEIIRLIQEFKPQKIVFDKNGVGLGLYERFTLLSNEFADEFLIDAFGTIVYKEI